MTEQKTENLDPLPGDFDDEFDATSPDNIRIAEASPEQHVSLQVVLSGTEGLSLERIAQARGQEPGEAVAELVRQAAH